MMVSKTILQSCAMLGRAPAEILEKTNEALNTVRDEEPEQILKAVRGAVDDFVKDAEQFDDLTMLCLEYKGKK